MIPGHTLRWGYFWEWLVLVSERGLDSRVHTECVRICMHVLGSPFKFWEVLPRPEPPPGAL